MSASGWRDQFAGPGGQAPEIQRRPREVARSPGADHRRLPRRFCHPTQNGPTCCSRTKERLP